MVLTNSEYETIMREYEELRLFEQKELERRRKEVYTALPVLESIDEQLIGGSIRALKQSFSGNEAAFDNLAETNRQLSEQKQALMRQKGFPEDYLEVSYRCPACKDTGLSGGKPCRCFKQSVISHFYMSPERRELLNRENFSTFRTDIFSKERIDETTGLSHYEEMQIILRQMKDYCANFETRKRDLLIHGATGVGKSFLTNCIAKALTDRGYTVLSIAANALFERLDTHWFHRDEEDRSASRSCEMLTECELLIIDDLGSEMTTQFTKSELFNLIEARHQLRRPIIISTNLSLNEIRERYTDRVSSRIFLYTAVQIKGRDLRIELQMNNS